MQKTVPASSKQGEQQIDTGWRVPGSLTYRWHGRYFKGAMKQLRAVKRVEADERNAVTPSHRRRVARR
jgi:hypothetical protein